MVQSYRKKYRVAQKK